MTKIIAKQVWQTMDQITNHGIIQMQYQDMQAQG
jgi:hypothetical protein